MNGGKTEFPHIPGYCSYIVLLIYFEVKEKGMS